MEVEKWLIEEMGFSADEAKVLAPQFASRQDRLAAGYVGKAQRDAFTAREAEIARAKADLEASNARLNEEMAGWAEMTAKERAAQPQLLADLEASRVRTAQLETRLSNLAREAGLDPQKVLENLTPLPPKKEEPPVPPIDTKQFVRREEAAPIFEYQLELPATLLHIQQEHQRLFGETLDPRKVTAEIKVRAGKNDPNIDPVAIWEQMYGVPAKREAVAKAQYEADIAAAEARGREAGLSERAMPGPGNPGRHAPVFRDTTGQFAPRTSRLSRPQPESTVRSAASALATGKYRVPVAQPRG